MKFPMKLPMQKIWKETMKEMILKILKKFWRHKIKKEKVLISGEKQWLKKCGKMQLLRIFFFLTTATSFIY